MTLPAPPLQTARRRPRRLGRLLRWVGALAAAAAVFALGVAVGQTLDDNPDPGGSITLVRTLEPLSLTPERETVTVTVGAR